MPGGGLGAPAPLTGFIILHGLLYSAFGVASPFLPSFIVAAEVEVLFLIEPWLLSVLTAGRRDCVAALADAPPRRMPNAARQQHKFCWCSNPEIGRALTLKAASNAASLALVLCSLANRCRRHR
jgi:hypothetical protein